MAIHKNFSKNPYDILNPEERWFPADETLREKGKDNRGNDERELRKQDIKYYGKDNLAYS